MIDENKIESLLAQLTIEEKVSLLAGDSLWTTPPVKRLGIPAMKVTDGPNGARGGNFAGGNNSACFPAGISLASTWNRQLVGQIGEALAEEAESKGAHLLLAPTVNIHRSPLNGRNFECYSEDPYLTAQMAVAYINGLQSKNIGATIKHFVCNDSEFERNSINSVVGERALREIYLPPFKAAVQEANTWAVMSAYNQLNGTFCSEHPYALIDILKEEWGFDGIVMSDWFGTKSTAESVNGGQDLEMPGPPMWRGDKLLSAIEAGDVDLERLDDSVRRMLRIFMKAGRFENPGLQEERAINRPEHQQIARQAAAEGIVLLKNKDNILPLDSSKLSQIAIIGPNAKTAVMMGGGSARVSSHYRVTPLEGIRQKVGDSIELAYAMGCTNHKMLPEIHGHQLSMGNGRLGLTADYYNSLDLSGDPVYQTEVQSTEQVWFGDIAPNVDRGAFSVRISGQFISNESGVHTFGLLSAGKSRFFANGDLLIDNWSKQEPGEAFFGTGTTEVSAELNLTAGEPLEISIEFSSEGSSLLSAVRLGCLTPVPADSIAQAASLAASADVAVVFVGLNGEWESEGHDRPDMELVGNQVSLITAVAQANPNTVVVLQTGSPVTMPWLDEVAGVLQAWFPGQEVGNAITDVLFGDVNPSGKLPQTFPVRLEDNPAFINYPGENGKVTYGEGIFVGYRYYEMKKTLPIFPFGFGLSYTSFTLDNLKLSQAVMAPNESVAVTIDVTNVGALAGAEVVQLYVRDVASSLVRPLKELKAFDKVFLEPGEAKTATMSLTHKSLAYFDDLKMKWVAEAGEFELLVGTSSTRIHAKAALTLSETITFGGPVAKEKVQLSLDNTIQELLDNEQAKEVLNNQFPGMLDNPQLQMALGMKLPQLAQFVPDVFTEEALTAVAEGLAKIG
ncbi:MAG: glycoside hydrolase family 3 C-terminal domain-containing protein [Chloroflexota bacterium]